MKTWSFSFTEKKAFLPLRTKPIISAALQLEASWRLLSFVLSNTALKQEGSFCAWCCHTSRSDCYFEPMEYVWPHNIVLVMNITVESCAYASSSLIPIWRFGTISIQMLMCFHGSHCLSDLQTAPVQGDNFSSGTNSRSTGLIHGGVRYLQKAIMKLDYKQVNASFFLRSWHLSAEFLVPLVILLYLPPGVHFSCTESTDMFALNDWLPGKKKIFSK